MARLATLIVLLVATLAFQAHAQTSGQCISTTTTVNVRDAPCGDVVVRVTAGSVLYVQGSARSTSCLGVNSWLPVKSGDSSINGWIATTYTQLASCPRTPTPSRSRTVQQAINAAGCETGVAAGLSQQLVTQINCLSPGTLVSIASIQPASLGSSVIPYLQRNAAIDLQAAIAKRGVTMTINSALRTLVQQEMLYRWYQSGLCGITAAATPGTSNHESGTAVDIASADSWISAMQSTNWQKLGSFDPPHYDYKGSSVALRSLSVKAFQTLWNLNNPTETLSVDGAFGPNTENALLRSPIDGFPISRC